MIRIAARHPIGLNTFVIVESERNPSRIEIARVCGVTDGDITISILRNGDIRTINRNEIISEYDGRLIDGIEIIQTSESRYGYNLRHDGETVISASGSGFKTKTAALFAAVEVLAMRMTPSDGVVHAKREMFMAADYPAP